MHHPEARQRQGQQHRLHTGGQLPGDGVAGADTPLPKSGRESQSLVPALAKGQAPITRGVDQQCAIGTARGPLLDKCPEG